MQAVLNTIDIAPEDAIKLTRLAYTFDLGITQLVFTARVGAQLVVEIRHSNIQLLPNVISIASSMCHACINGSCHKVYLLDDNVSQLEQ